MNGAAGASKKAATADVAQKSGKTSPVAAKRSVPQGAASTAPKSGSNNSTSSKSLVSQSAAGVRNGHQSLATASPSAKAGKAMGKKARVSSTPTVLPPGYRPTEKEPFMGGLQRLYFRNKLLQWKDDIIKQNRETLQVLHEDTLQHADLADRATSETDRALELRARDRQRKLVSKIDAAIARIDDGSYGYCEETGEPISLKRLDARPIATLSLEAQERHERRERVYRES